MMKLFLCLSLYLIYTPFRNGKSINIKFKIEDTINFPKFDGIGAISGGGATSKLLLTYKEPYRSQILDYLFKPQFGASLHLLKVEIGGDAQSTEGTEASHSHNSNDLNCYRGYEWQLIAEAKKRNPSILLYGLSWAFPGWVGNYTGNPFYSSTLLTKYVLDWLKCGRNTYNFEFQYIGIWNEKRYDINYIKTLRKTLDKEGFNKVQIVGADIKWEIASDILKDSELSKSIYAIGCHYPGTYSSDLAKQTGKPLWSSEDYSTANTETGPGCWARILNQNFVNGNMTSTIAWNLIAAYYDDLPYPRCGLMTAIEPWSGHYEVPSTIWVTAHTTQFTRPGWVYLPVNGGSGNLIYGGSYVSFIDPLTKNFTIVFESLSHENSVCIRPYLPPFNVIDQNITLYLSPDISQAQFYLWRSDLSSNDPSKIFKLEKVLKPDSSGRITFFLPVNNLVTISTVSTAKKSSFPPSPNPKPFPASYEDNFEKYPLHSEPDLLAPQVGSFEVVNLTSSSKVVEQTVTDFPIFWCFPSAINVVPIALIGDFNNSDVTLTVSVMIPSSAKSANSVFLGSRINNSGCTTFLAGGVFFWLNFTSNEFLISSDLHANKVYAQDKLKLDFNQWYNISIFLKTSVGWFFVNDELISSVDNLYNSSPIHGFAGFGTDKYGTAYFDNFKMKSV